MKIKKILFVASGFILTASLLVSCAKSKNSAPAGTLKLQFNPLNANVTLGTTTTSTNSKLSWTEGFLNVTEVHVEGIPEVEGKNETEGKDEKDDSMADSTSVVNLFNPNQKFVNLEVAAGNYSNVKFRIEIAQKLTTPALFVKGTFTDSKGNIIPTQCSINNQSTNNYTNGGEHDENDDNELEIRATASTLNVTAQNAGTATVNLDFNLLFTGITDVALETATRVNGQIIIDNANNTAIYNIVRSNVNSFSHMD